MIILNYPNGEFTNEPGEREIQSLLFQPEEHFNPSGCGEASIESRNNSMKGLLGIRFIPEVGFSFEHMMASGKAENYGPSYISCSVDNNAKALSTSVGGMPLLLPSNSFHNSNISQLIVIFFMGTMGRSPLVSWVQTAELPEHLYGQ